MNAELDRRSLLRAGAVVAGTGAMAVTTGAGAEPGVPRPRPTVGFVVGTPTVTPSGGAATVRVSVLTGGLQVVLETQSVTEVRAEQIADSVQAGTLVDFVVSAGEASYLLIRPPPSTPRSARRPGATAARS
jgi:hypothetical protein